jgi:hypothetical protein
MERPFGVTLFASYFFVQSIINVVAFYSYYVEGASLFVVAYYVVSSAVGFVLAYGLWCGYKWGKLGTIILSGWEILIGLLGTVVALEIEPTSPIQAVTKTMVYAIVIYFLTRPGMSEYFRR